MKREKFYLEFWMKKIVEDIRPINIFKEESVEKKIQRKLYPEKEYPYLYNKDYVRFGL